MSTRRAREQHYCFVSDIFVCAFAHISQEFVSHPCKLQAYMRARTSTVALSSLTEPLWDGVHIEQLAPARFQSGRDHRHVSFCALPCRTQARATSVDTPVSARTLRGAMFALRPQRKDVRGQLLGLSLNQNPATRAFDINSPQLNLLRGDSMSLKGHRLLVKDAEWCHPAYRKFEGAHPSKG